MRKLLLLGSLGCWVGCWLGCGGSAMDPQGQPSAENDASAPIDGGASDARTTPDAPITDSAIDAPVVALDPTMDGPFAITESDAMTKVAATKDNVPVHVAMPTGAGTFPVVVIAHGFQIPATQYYGYAKRLATFGYIALVADYPAGFTSVDNVRDAKNLSGALDWALATYAGKTGKAGVMGHSRGGKAAALAASMDARFVAVLGLDPVDTKPPLPCDPQTQCPDARDALAKTMIPSAFLGETTDATGQGTACAPAAGNYQTFYAKAPSPSLSVTVSGANHMSFIADPKACGFTCSFCNAATTAQAQVLDLAYAMTVAFFERRVRGVAGYDAWLTGPQVAAHWGSIATVVSK